MHPFLKSYRLLINFKSHINLENEFALKHKNDCSTPNNHQARSIALFHNALCLICTSLLFICMLMCMYGGGGFALSSYITFISRTANQRSVFSPHIFFNE